VGYSINGFPAVEQSCRVAWWNTYKKAAADAIANQRSAVSLNVKRELKGKSQTWKRKEMDITIQLMTDCFYFV
jgi:hypothetical protein